MIKSPHRTLAQNYWKNHLNTGDLAIDATCGNGHDSLFIGELNVTVFSLDIQEIALLQAKTRIDSSLDLSFIQRSHEFIDELSYPKPPRLIVYNLGYLPGGDKSITTKSSTTLQSLKKSMKILSFDGAISITCYPGHEEGAKEERALLEFLSSLSKKEWTLCLHQHINRPKSPSFIWMTRVQKPLDLPKSAQLECEV